MTDVARSDVTKVLLIDDHPVVRQGLRQLLDFESDLEVCGEAGTLSEGLAQVEALAPDLAIVDIALGAADGLDLVRQIRSRWPGVRILVLSMLGERLYAEHALRSGAQGYVMKQEAPEILLTAIRRVLEGGVHVSDHMQQVWLERAVGGRRGGLELPLSSLTDRELTVLRLIGQGYNTRRSADELKLSIKTIESHRDNIRRKLTLDNSAELIRYATLWIERGAGGGGSASAAASA